jgi:UDP-glucose 4-epimerase
MKSLVTGGAGFIGSNLVDRLINLGHEVVVIDNMTSESHESFYWNSKAQNYTYSIFNYELIKDLFVGVDYVFHLAAEVSIPKAIQDPIKTVYNNTFGTEVVLQCAKEAGVKKFMFSSTSAIYGANPSPNIETQPTDCLNPYSVSKFAGEELCKMYYKLYNLPTVIFRYFNVYGERQPLKGQYAPVIGIFLNQVKNNQPLTIVGDGNQRRDFVYVGDVCRANILAATTDVDESCYGEVYNVGTNNNISVKELASLISSNQTHIPPRIGEVRFSLANNKKLMKTFNWQPEMDVKDWIKSVGL